MVVLSTRGYIHVRARFRLYSLPTDRRGRDTPTDYRPASLWLVDGI